MSSLFLDIYGVKISISAPLEIFKLIENDFISFKSAEIDESHYSFVLHNGAAPDISSHRRKLSFKYKGKTIIFLKNSGFAIDYYGRALALFEDKNNLISLFSEDRDMLREIAYLAILSFSGYIMEQKGLYRIHAMAFQYMRKNYMVLAGMGGGKTRLFMALSDQERCSVYSDEIVLIDNKCKLHAFPLRLGLKEEDKGLFKDYAGTYTIKRSEYGMKYLLKYDEFVSNIPDPAEITASIALKMKGNLSDTELPQLEKGTRTLILALLMKNFVIGLGMPVLFEYVFISYKKGGLFRLINNLGCRLIICFKLILKDAYCLCLSGNDNKNAKYLLDELNIS